MERKLEDAEEDKDIDVYDMVGIDIAGELITTATKKSSETCHREEQARIRTDIGVKPKCVFEKLIERYKKKR